MGAAWPGWGLACRRQSAAATLLAGVRAICRAAWLAAARLQVRSACAGAALALPGPLCPHGHTLAVASAALQDSGYRGLALLGVAAVSTSPVAAFSAADSSRLSMVVTQNDLSKAEVGRMDQLDCS